MPLERCSGVTVGVYIGFDANENEVTLVSATGERALDKAAKDDVAAAILDELEALLADG